MSRPVEKCYPSGSNTVLSIAGYVLLAVGILLLFICIPRRVWLALIGVLLIAAGWFLLKLSNAWR